MCRSETVFAVYLCGPTDCFLNAMFVDEDQAHNWGKIHRTYTDDYFVKELTYDELVKALKED